MKKFKWLFWIAIVMIYLYDQRLLAEKLQTGHFVVCLFVRALGLLFIGLFHQEFLWPYLFERQRWILYGGGLAILLLIYTVLQNTWDVYLFGYVIGDFEQRNFWQGFPHTLFAAFWFVAIASAFHLSLEWINQRHEIASLQNQIGGLREQAASLPATKATANEVFLKSGIKKIRVNLAEVTHLQGLKDYSIIFTPSEKIIVKGSLKNTEELFPLGTLLRVHKSYFVVKDKVDKMQSDAVFIGEIKIPIGRSYQKEVSAVLL